MASLTDLFDVNKNSIKTNENFDIISESKSSESESICIPHISADHPKYDEYCKDLKKLKKTTPTLYKKIVGWD